MPTSLSFIAYVFMFLGLIGAVLPLLPGAPLIWLGAFIWAWADGFHAYGWPTLLILALLALLSWGSDLIVTTVTARRAGAGWKGVIAAIAGGLVGALVLGAALPVVGAVGGTMIGAATGMLVLEYRAKHDWGQAWRAAAAYIVGYIISSAVQLAICVSMIAIFIIQAHF